MSAHIPDSIEMTPATLQDTLIDVTNQTNPETTKNALNDMKQTNKPNILITDMSATSMNQDRNIDSVPEQCTYSITNNHAIQIRGESDEILNSNSNNLQETEKCPLIRKDPWSNIGSLHTPAKTLTNSNSAQACPQATEHQDILTGATESNVQQVQVHQCPICSKEYPSKHELLMHAIDV